MRDCLRRTLACLAAVLLLMPIAAHAVSQSPYAGYTYDAWGRSVPAPSGYLCQQVIYPQDTSAGAISGARDLFVYRDMLYIADTGNDRILVLDEQYDFVREMREFTLPDGTPTALNKPSGLYIREERILIADTENGRVLDCDMEGNVSQVFTRPQTEFINAAMAFRPAKVGRDASGFVYVLAEGIYQGLLCYDSDGQFTGFYGSNKVTVNLSVIVMQLWKKLLSQEQAQSMERFIPVEMANLFIDADDFIFSVTNGSVDATQRSTGKVQRLNPLGNNVLRYNERDVQASGGALYRRDIYGDVEYAYVKSVLVDSVFVDIHVDENGVFSVLDRERGRIFQYDKEGNLLFIFGGIGNQKGTFAVPSAIEKFAGQYVVLDESMNSLTVFRQTSYARLVLEAAKLYNEGLYAQAEPIWRKVLAVNAGNTMAYRSIGKYYLEQKDYGAALECLKLGQDRDAYSMAFSQYRKAWLQENFLWLAAACAAGFVLLRYLLRLLLKKLGFERKRTRIVFH